MMAEASQRYPLFRFPILVLIALGVAFGGGIWSVRKALDATTGFGALKAGLWEAFPLAQTGDADPYAKAHRSRDGKLLYASAEAVPFNARRDADGALLDSSCDYTLSGASPAARLWTLQAVAWGEGMAADPTLPTALNSSMVVHDGAGTFAITLSSRGKAGNWLALPKVGRFELILTLFDTPAINRSGLSELVLPTIVKTGCGHA